MPLFNSFMGGKRNNLLKHSINFAESVVASYMNGNQVAIEANLLGKSWSITTRLPLIQPTLRFLFERIVCITTQRSIVGLSKIFFMYNFPPFRKQLKLFSFSHSFLYIVFSDDDREDDDFDENNGK